MSDTATIGHNSEGVEYATKKLAKDQLRSIVDRIGRLEEDKKAIADDIHDVYAEAKSNGFDVKALREIVRRRKADAKDLAEHEAIVETYLVVLGMV